VGDALGDTKRSGPVELFAGLEHEDDEDRDIKEDDISRRLLAPKAKGRGVLKAVIADLDAMDAGVDDLSPLKRRKHGVGRGAATDIEARTRGPPVIAMDDDDEGYSESKDRGTISSDLSGGPSSPKLPGAVMISRTHAPPPGTRTPKAKGMGLRGVTPRRTPRARTPHARTPRTLTPRARTPVAAKPPPLSARYAVPSPASGLA
jgi:hypothetical protein